MVNFPPVPLEVKPIAHLLKIADEHEIRNIVVAYWARMAACRLALQLVPGKKSPETAELIRMIIDWLEQTKKVNLENEGIMNQTTAQALIEEYSLRVFEHADNLDKQAVFNKNTVKTFYTAGLLMDILDQFDNVDDEFKEKRKYAKWKAAYIHNCLKNGEIPIPGPREVAEDDENGIVHKTLVDADDLKNYTRYEEPGGSSTTSDVPSNPAPGYLDPGTINLGDMGNTNIPSPITPILPTNPTPFNTPVPQVSPTVTPAAIPSAKPTLPSTDSTSGYVPNPEEIQKAQKYCKYAASALNYDDVKNAVDYLTKAMELLKTGKE